VSGEVFQVLKYGGGGNFSSLMKLYTPLPTFSAYMNIILYNLLDWETVGLCNSFERKEYFLTLYSILIKNFPKSPKDFKFPKSEVFGDEFPKVGHPASYASAMDFWCINVCSKLSVHLTVYCFLKNLKTKAFCDSALVH